MKFFKIHHFILLTFIITTVCNCHSSSSSDAFGDDPQIEPKIEFTYPSNNLEEITTDFPINGKIILMFNKKIDFTTIQNGTQIINDKDETVNGEWAEIPGDYPYIVSFETAYNENQYPDCPFKPETNYRLLLNSIKDTEGLFVEDCEIAFKTAILPDTTAPEPVNANDGSDILVETRSPRKLTIPFKEQLNPDQDTIHEDLFDLQYYSTENSVILESVTYDVETQSIIIVPKEDLHYNVKYILYVYKGAVQDLAGNECSRTTSKAFTLEPEIEITAEKNFEDITIYDVQSLPNSSFVMTYYDKADKYSKFVIFDKSGNEKIEPCIIDNEVEKNDGVVTTMKVTGFSDSSFAIVYTEVTSSYGGIGKFKIYDMNGICLNENDEPIVFEIEEIQTNRNRIKVSTMQNDNFVISYYFNDWVVKGQFVIYNKDGEQQGNAVLYRPTEEYEQRRSYDLTTIDNNILLCYIEFQNNANIYTMYSQDGTLLVSPTIFDTFIGDSVITRITANNHKFILVYDNYQTGGFDGNGIKYIIYDENNNVVAGPHYFDDSCLVDFYDYIGVKSLMNNNFLIFYANRYYGKFILYSPSGEQITDYIYIKNLTSTESKGLYTDSYYSTSNLGDNSFVVAYTDFYFYSEEKRYGSKSKIKIYTILEN